MQYILAHLYHICSEVIDQQKSIQVVFCDMSKAFDRIWRIVLLAKLSGVSVRGALVRWFEKYLCNRQQRGYDK